MSPTTTGSTGAVIHDHQHVALPTVPRHQDLDPWERIERAQARRAIQSPIKLRDLDAGEEARLLREAAPERPRKPAKRTAPMKEKRERQRGNKTRRSSSVQTPKGNVRHQDLREQIAVLAGRGATSTDIALELGASPATVRRHAKAAGIDLPRPSGPGTGHSWDVEAAIELARQGRTAVEIASTVGIGSASVRRELRRRGIAITDGRTRSAGRRTCDAVVQEVIALHTGDEHLSPPQIARRVGTMPTTVRRILDREGIPRRDGRAEHSGGANRVTTTATPEQLQQLYDDLGTIKAVARHLNIGQSTAGRLLHAAGVQLRSPSEIHKGRPGRDRGARSLAQEITAAGVTAAHVRAWAQENNHPIATVGLPSKKTWQAYQAAHTTTRTPWSRHA